MLSRFTSLASAIDLLTNHRLTLLNPAGWQDRTDASAMEQFKIKGEYKTVLAACLTERVESFHLWDGFSKRGGVCIRFSPSLAKHIEVIGESCEERSISIGKVDYWTFDDLRQNRYVIYSQLPFRKQMAYAAEAEWRILYTSRVNVLQTVDVPLPPDFVREIILDPWLPSALVSPLEQVLKSIPDCGHVMVRKSDIIENESFIATAKGAADRAWIDLQSQP